MIVPYDMDDGDDDNGQAPRGGRGRGGGGRGRGRGGRGGGSRRWAPRGQINEAQDIELVLDQDDIPAELYYQLTPPAGGHGRGGRGQSQAQPRGNGRGRGQRGRGNQRGGGRRGSGGGEFALMDVDDVDRDPRPQRNARNKKENKRVDADLEEKGFLGPYKAPKGAGWVGKLMEVVSVDNVDDVKKMLREASKAEHVRKELAKVRGGNGWDESMRSSIAPWEDCLDMVFDDLSNPLIIAAWKNSRKCAEFLIEDFKVDVSLPGKRGIQPIMIAAMYGHAQMIELLVKHGAAVNCKDVESYTPLHIAAKLNYPSCVQALLQVPGIDINAANVEGDTPLSLATQNAHLKIIELLLPAGASVSYEFMGSSPLEDLVMKLDELKSSKGSSSKHKSKGKKKEKNNAAEIAEINHWILELAMRLPSPTHAFESLKDNELADQLLEKMINAYNGKLSFVSTKVHKWDENFMSYTGVNRFLAAVSRFWKKTKKMLDISPAELSIILKCLAVNGQSATIESLCSNFYQPHNIEWISCDILRAFSTSLCRAMKIVIFGQEPYLETCTDFVFCAGKIYLRMVLASNHMYQWTSFDDLGDFWRFLDSSLELMDENAQETNRFACLVYIFHLWCQVDKCCTDEHEEKSAAPRKISLHSLESNPVPNEKFKQFAAKHRTAMIYLAEDSQDCGKFLGFIPGMKHSVDLAARSAIFSLVLARESFKHGDQDFPIILNRMDDEDLLSSVDIAVSQFIQVPGFALNQQLEVNFVGEQGIGDGPAREGIHYIFSLLKKLEMFSLSPSQEVYTLNYDYAHSNAMLHYECAGRIVAASITRALPLGFPICQMLLKHAAKRTNFEISDIKDFDSDLSKSLAYISDNDVDKLHEMYWLVNGPNGEEIELIPNGSKVLVTNDNKAKYIQAFAEFKTLGLPKSKAADAFTKGFRDVMFGQWIHVLSVEDMFLLVNGPRTVDVSLLKHRTEFIGFEDGSHPITEWFWEVFSEFEEDRKRKLLLFWTGSEVPPICLDNAENGNSYSEEERWTVQQLDCSTRNLPQSSTCSHNLKFPLYESKEILRAKILQAIQYGASGYDHA